MHDSSVKTNFFLCLLALCISQVNVCQQVCIAEVRKVLACPITGQDWINFSKLKNCSSRNHVCSSFVPLKYHCLPNAFRNETFEMCATDADIIGFSCAEYNEGGGCIQPNFDIKCDGPKFFPKCPFKYPSSDIYLYSGCFVFGNDKVENGSITKIRTTPKGNPANKLPVEFIIPPFLFLMICLIIFIVYRCAKDHSNTSRQDEMGGIVSAKEGAKPKVTTTAATTTTSIPSSTYNTAQNMTYTAAGSATAGAIILFGLMAIILVMKKRLRRRINKGGSPENDLVHKNEVFDKDIELLDSNQYVTSQHMAEFGYTSDQNHQHILSTAKPKNNLETDVFPHSKPEDSSMSIYSVPNKNTEHPWEISNGNVYAQVNKQNRRTAHNLMQTPMQ